MKKVYRGIPSDIAQEIQKDLKQRGIDDSENTEMYQEILVETLST